MKDCAYHGGGGEEGWLMFSVDGKFGERENLLQLEWSSSSCARDSHPTSPSLKLLHFSPRHLKLGGLHWS